MQSGLYPNVGWSALAMVHGVFGPAMVDPSTCTGTPIAGAIGVNPYMQAGMPVVPAAADKHVIGHPCRFRNNDASVHHSLFHDHGGGLHRNGSRLAGHRSRLNDYRDSLASRSRLSHDRGGLAGPRSRLRDDNWRGLVNDHWGRLIINDRWRTPVGSVHDDNAVTPRQH